MTEGALQIDDVWWRLPDGRLAYKNARGGLTPVSIAPAPPGEVSTRGMEDAVPPDIRSGGRRRGR